jgi:hypothetical protein
MTRITEMYAKEIIEMPIGHFKSEDGRCNDRAREFHTLTQTTKMK